MTKDELFHLLDALSLPDNIISRLDAAKRQFWKRNNQTREEEIFYFLREYIEQRSRQTDAKVRENAYLVISKLLLRTFDAEYSQFLIDRLNTESNKYVLHTMLSGIGRLPLTEDIDVSPIAACSKHHEWLVRHSAIIALGKSDTDISREAVRYWVNQTDEKQYKYELIYANAALGFVGVPNDIVLLEQHTQACIHDVKESAIYAINRIKQRYE